MRNPFPASSHDTLAKVRTIPVFDRVTAFVKGLPEGDRLIVTVLVSLVVLASVHSLYSLERSLLVTVPTYGGSLSEGAVGSPQFINPLLAISDADRDLATLTYAGLMGLTGKGTLTPVLASGYDVSTDGKVYTFTLRDGTVFSDGTPLTSADVVFTIEKAQDASLKSPEYADWAGVKAEALDAKTVRFTLSRPYAPFVSLTTLGILPARLWQQIDSSEFPFSNLETNPVGAGPFMVTDVIRDASGLIKSVILEANPRYVLGRPYLDSIQFTFYANDEDLASALRAGVVESAYDTPAPRVLTSPYTRVFAVFWNQNQKQVYARPEVRKALSLAIDREALIADVLGGYATPLMGPVPPGGLITQFPVAHSSSTTADAASVLTKAGWSYDAATRSWNNATLKQSLDAITIRTSNVAELKNVATAVKGAWERLGIPVTIELYEPGDLSQNVIRPRNYEALLYGEVIGRDQDLYPFWSSQERNDPGLNIAMYTNRTVDTLLESARTSTDSLKRTIDLQKIEDTIASEYPAAFLYAPDFTYAVPEDLYGVALPPIIVPADRFAGVATWYRESDAVWPLFAKDN